jgi:hypothetical protein
MILKRHILSCIISIIGLCPSGYAIPLPPPRQTPHKPPPTITNATVVHDTSIVAEFVAGPLGDYTFGCQLKRRLSPTFLTPETFAVPVVSTDCGCRTGEREEELRALKAMEDLVVAFAIDSETRVEQVAEKLERCDTHTREIVMDLHEAQEAARRSHQRADESDSENAQLFKHVKTARRIICSLSSIIALLSLVLARQLQTRRRLPYPDSERHSGKDEFAGLRTATLQGVSNPSLRVSG